MKDGALRGWVNRDGALLWTVAEQRWDLAPALPVSVGCCTGGLFAKAPHLRFLALSSLAAFGLLAKMLKR